MTGLSVVRNTHTPTAEECQRRNENGGEERERERESSGKANPRLSCPYGLLVTIESIMPKG